MKNPNGYSTSNQTTEEIHNYYTWARVVSIGVLILGICAMAFSSGCATDSTTSGDDDDGNGSVMTGSGSGSAMTPPDAGAPDAPQANPCASYSWMMTRQWTCSNWSGNYDVTLTSSNNGICSLSIAGSGAKEMSQVTITRSDDNLVNKLVMVVSQDTTLTCFQNAN
ncbi:MAG TPA: hypothetical protein VLK22_04440 [Candidatus Udaeobacter sp.]|nr:hypothetical protein [Candidatus Udaeobacter sp.]